LLVFNKNEASIGIDSKSYLTDDSILQIDLLSDEVTNRVWRSYYINSLGLVYKITQNIYTELYYYNSDNLHVKTETFVNDYRSTRTIFNYKYNPHHN
ncbi:MAG: hypothetical protein K9J13_05160, partial [Saprospiraceae bacterium]|nr:hypothetical protein [Saprospiraceae bacterium]